jgi:hypothetical protein
MEHDLPSPFNPCGFVTYCLPSPRSDPAESDLLLLPTHDKQKGPAFHNHPFNTATTVLLLSPSLLPIILPYLILPFSFSHLNRLHNLFVIISMLMP